MVKRNGRGRTQTNPPVKSMASDSPARSGMPGGPSAARRTYELGCRSRKSFLHCRQKAKALVSHDGDDSWTEDSGRRTPRMTPSSSTRPPVLSRFSISASLSPSGAASVAQPVAGVSLSKISLAGGGSMRSEVTNESGMSISCDESSIRRQTLGGLRVRSRNCRREKRGKGRARVSWNPPPSERNAVVDFE